MKTTIDGLDETIMEELEGWASKDLKQAINEGMEEAAEAAEKMLKKGGPYEEKTGKYTKDWTHGQRSSRASSITGLNSYSVYNKKHYQLTHLLEKGHASRNGGRVKAFPHIAAVNDTVGELAISKIKRNVEGIG
ncbi:MAG: HK97 gp10 family phage protein [Acetatifactor sp.]|nr:HK97 gp10 family phage protein [Acetatifactor sp.]